jgi:hypothetical protein
MQRLPHPQKGIPAGLHSIREAHENDTWVEWCELRTLDDEIERYALKSLNNNRTINFLYGALFRGAVCDADLRTLCPSIGEITVGDLIAAGDWLEAA